MSVGYNVNEGSMDFNSGTNLTSGIQDRCCTRWWRSRNGFERWMVIVVIFLSTVIVALSVAVGVLDQIAHPSVMEPPTVNPVAEVGNLFDHMEENVNKASQLTADTEISFNQTLLWLQTVETILTEYDDEDRKKRFVEDIKVFGRYRRDVNTPQDNSTTVGPTEIVTQVVNSNGSDVITTVKEETPEITTQAMSLNQTTPKLNQTTLVQVTQPPTTQSSNNSGIKATTQSSNNTVINVTTQNNNETVINATSPAPITVNPVVANLTAELNNTKHELNITSKLLEEKRNELINLNNTLNNQTTVLNTKIELLANQSLELNHIREELNKTEYIGIQKDDQINDLNNTIKLTMENLTITKQTLLDTQKRIQFLELYINETTGILIPVLEILERIYRPINQTYHSMMEVKGLLRQVNNTLYETDLPFNQKNYNQNQTKLISEFIDVIETKLENIKTNFIEMEVQSIAIKEPLDILQSKLHSDENNTALLSKKNQTKNLLNQSVMNMKGAEISLKEINNYLTNTVANLTQTLTMLSKIQVEVKTTTTVKVITTTVTTPTLNLNATTPVPNLNSTENGNLTSNALKSSSTVLLSGKLEIFILVISVIGYGVMV